MEIKVFFMAMQKWGRGDQNCILHCQSTEYPQVVHPRQLGNKIAGGDPPLEWILRLLSLEITELSTMFGPLVTRIEIWARPQEHP